MLINTDWLKFDRHAKMLVEQNLYTQEVSDTVDNNIISVCEQYGVDIPVDGSGYIDSPHIRKLAVDYAIFTLFTGNWGVVDSDKDVFSEKASYHEKQYRDAVAELTNQNNVREGWTEVVKSYLNNSKYTDMQYDELPRNIQLAVDELVKDNANRTTGVTTKTINNIVQESYTAEAFSPLVKQLLAHDRSMVLS